MIEVEKKFILKERDIDRLTKNAEFLSEELCIDSYFDTDSYSLTSKDIWLRSRLKYGKKFELKLPLNFGKGASKRKLDQYRELTTDDQIRKALGVPNRGTLAEDLEQSGYKPFCTLTTTRRKYRKGNFTLDLDVVDFGYSIGEIELMVNKKSEMESALNKILRFARSMGLSVAPVRGKVLEFIKRNRPEHYQVLVDTGVA